MMMNHTTGALRAGSSSVTFPIRLPRSGGLAGQDGKTLGIPISLSFSREQVPSVNFSATYYTRTTYNTYPFRLMMDRPAANTPVNIGKRLDKHMGSIKEAFPLFQDTPQLSYSNEDAQDPHFTLRLPPRSAFYSTNEEFWKAFGFATKEEDAEQIQDTVRLVGGRGKGRIERKRVYGFFNASFINEEYRRSDIYPPGLPLNVILEGAEMPRILQVQVEMLEATNVRVDYINNPVRMEKTEVIGALSWIFETISTRAGWIANLVDVISGPEDLIYLTNRTVPNSGTNLTVFFNEEMCAALNFPYLRPFGAIFNTEAGRTYQMNVPRVWIDPLKDKYPVTLIATNVGEATSWFEGLGYVSLMAVVREGDTKEPFNIRSEGCVFRINQSDLTLEFYDSRRQKIIFDVPLQANLIMTFKTL